MLCLYPLSYRKNKIPRLSARLVLIDLKPIKNEIHKSIFLYRSEANLAMYQNFQNLFYEEEKINPKLCYNNHLFFGKYL